MRPTHSILTVSPFLIVAAKGMSGCHLLCSFSCFSAGVVKETGPACVGQSVLNGRMLSTPKALTAF